MSRRGTPWLGAHAPRAASGRVEEQGWRRRPLQPPGQKLGVEPRTCAGCSDSTSAPPEAAGAWLLQASEPTTLAEVYMQISCTRAPNFVYTAGVVHAAERTRTPAHTCVVFIEGVTLLLLSFLREQKGERAPPGPAARRAALSRVSSETACREPGPSFLNKLPLPN